MLKRFIVIFLGMFLLSGCSDSARGYFKKSANNKLIDTKGYHGSKHPPLYNKKYVTMAKRNVMEENYDDDEDELLSEDDTETINPALRNRQMYLEMVKQDTMRIKQQKSQKGKKSSYTLESASTKINKEDIAKDEARIQKELEQIKLMLKETQKELERYSCSGKKSHTAVEVAAGDNLPTTNSIQENTKNSSTKTQMKKKFLSEDFDNNKPQNAKTTDYKSIEHDNDSQPRAI